MRNAGAGAARRAVRRMALAVALTGPVALMAPARAGSAPGLEPTVPHLPGAPACRVSQAAADQPTGGRNKPPAAPSYLAADFPRFSDDSWPDALIGGFGGVRRGARLHHTPVVFVHGNQADGQNWLDVMLQFQNDAHYTMQEMYALSYNGLGNYYAGAPTRVPPADPDQDYVAQNQRGLANGGNGAADEDEVPDLCRFVEEVQWYTGSRQIDIVTHSLGDTIARRFMADYPTLARDVVAFVGIAGANHGTSVCRGLDSSYYGCNEIAPGSSWLAELNGPGGSRETYAPTAWMTVYNGAAGDPFFDPPLDEGSPVLRGAVNLTFPGTYHNDLRVDPAEVDSYLEFLLAHGQAGPGADGAGRTEAAALARQAPDGLSGQLCGVPALTGPVPGCPG